MGEGAHFCIIWQYLISETDHEGEVEVLAPFPRCLHCSVLVEYLFSVDIAAEQSVGKQTYLWHKGNCVLMGGFICGGLEDGVSESLSSRHI